MTEESVRASFHTGSAAHRGLGTAIWTLGPIAVFVWSDTLYRDPP